MKFETVCIDEIIDKMELKYQQFPQVEVARLCQLTVKHPIMPSNSSGSNAN